MRLFCIATTGQECPWSAPAPALPRSALFCRSGEPAATTLGPGCSSKSAYEVSFGPSWNLQRLANALRQPPQPGNVHPGVLGLPGVVGGFGDAILASALERKNCLFCGSGDGSDRAAAIYNPIGTATLNGLDPEAYLRQRHRPHHRASGQSARSAVALERRVAPRVIGGRLLLR